MHFTRHLVIGSALVFAAPALAQNGDRASKLVEDMEACVKIADSDQRLSCYDRTVGSLAKARADKEVVVVDREEVSKTRRSLFGLKLPEIKLFGGDEEPLRQLESKVASARSKGYDKWIVRLEDGSEWETIETVFGYEPRPGDAILIKRGPIGNYLANIAGRRAVRIRRLQ